MVSHQPDWLTSLRLTLITLETPLSGGCLALESALWVLPAQGKIAEDLFKPLPVHLALQDHEKIFLHRMTIRLIRPAR